MGEALSNFCWVIAGVAVVLVIWLAPMEIRRRKQ